MKNGTGVKVGLTKISDVVGYEYSNGNKVHIDGRLIYRGYDIDDLVSMRKDTPFGFELSAFLLIFGKLPTHRQLLDFHKELIKMADAHNVDIHYQTSNLLNAIQIEVLKLYGEDIDPDSDTLEESCPIVTLRSKTEECSIPFPAPSFEPERILREISLLQLHISVCLIGYFFQSFHDREYEQCR